MVVQIEYDSNNKDDDNGGGGTVVVVVVVEVVVGVVVVMKALVVLGVYRLVTAVRCHGRIVFLFAGISKMAEVHLKHPKDHKDISEGGEVHLRCAIDGNPEPTIDWYKNKVRYVSLS